MERLANDLRRHEGLRLDPYKCSKGHLTIGYGHKIVGEHLIDPLVAECLLRFDLANAVSASYRLPWPVLKNLDEARRRVIVNMIFNMGLSKVRRFYKMLRAIEDKDFDKAADEMLDSRWASQVGNRAVELAKIMREGK